MEKTSRMGAGFLAGVVFYAAANALAVPANAGPESTGDRLAPQQAPYVHDGGRSGLRPPAAYANLMETLSSPGESDDTRYQAAMTLLHMADDNAVLVRPVLAAVGALHLADMDKQKAVEDYAAIVQHNAIGKPVPRLKL
jgi:hypothetical protein